MARPINPTPPLRYHKPSRSWYIFTRGRRVHLGGNKRVAESKRLQMIGASLGGAAPESAKTAATGGLTLAAALAQFREWAPSRYHDSRAIYRFDSAISAAVAVHGGTPADAIDGQAVEDIREHLLADVCNRTGRPLARGYVNDLVRAVKTMFAWLKRRRLVAANTLSEVRQVRALAPGDGGRETNPVPPVADWVVAATVCECSPTVRAMVALQRATGMRPGELCSMRRRDLSTSPAEVLAVPGQSRAVAAVEVDGVPIWFYVPAKHKNLHRGKMRAVAIGPDGQRALAPFLDRNPDDYLFRPADEISPAEGRALRVGPCYCPRSYHNAIVRAVARANRIRKQAAERGLVPVFVQIPHWSPNQLRHAAAEAVAEKVDAESAANMLGHSASRRALDAYVQGCILRAAETAAKVG